MIITNNIKNATIILFNIQFLHELNIDKKLILITHCMFDLFIVYYNSIQIDNERICQDRLQ